MKTNNAIDWEQLAEQKQQTRSIPGLSLITAEELTILNNKKINGNELGDILTIKAIFGGTII